MCWCVCVCVHLCVYMCAYMCVPVCLLDLFSFVKWYVCWLLVSVIIFNLLKGICSNNKKTVLFMSLFVCLVFHSASQSMCTEIQRKTTNWLKNVHFVLHNNNICMFTCIQQVILVKTSAFIYIYTMTTSKCI